MPHQKAADRKYFRLKFNPKSIVLLNAMLFALCAVLLPAAALAAEVTLGWDSNPEPDLEGYVVYRNVSYPGPPYNYSDTLAEDELVDPLHPRATLTGLQEGKSYYIALTAYNTDGVESTFSENVCVEVVNGVTEACSASVAPVANTVSSSGGSSGGGGSCFISASAADLLMFSTRFAGLSTPGRIISITIMILLLILMTAIKPKKLKARS